MSKLDRIVMQYHDEEYKLCSALVESLKDEIRKQCYGDERDFIDVVDMAFEALRKEDGK